MGILSDSICRDALGIVVALIVVTIAYFKWKFGYWKRRGVEHPTPVIPFGNIYKMISKKASFGTHFTNMYQEFKSKGLRYFGCYFSARPAFVVVDLDLVKAIMTTDFQHFTDHGNYVNEKEDPLTGHLFGLKGSKWRHLRVKLTPTFTSGKMKMMFQTLVDCSKSLVNVMDNIVESHEPLDIKDIVGRFTTDIIGSCAFGLECNSLKDPNSEFRLYGRKLFEADISQMLIRFISVAYPPLMSLLKLKFFPKDVSKFFVNVVEQTVKYREDNKVVRKDFMHLLIQLKNNVNIKDEEHSDELHGDHKTDESSFTMDQVAAQAFVFFIAGFETSSTTLTFCFYELATNQDIQNTLRKEVIDVLAKHNGQITYDALAEMTYMDKCVQETLRKYPPIPILFRECTETYKIPDSNVTIEKGTRLFIPIMGIQRDEEYYPNPDKFDPERFSPESKLARHHFAWLPFGEGPRLCIGLRFGLMQTKVALAVLLSNYKFTLNSKTQMPLTMGADSAVLSIKGGLWLDATKLDSK